MSKTYVTRCPIGEKKQEPKMSKDKKNSKRKRSKVKRSVREKTRVKLTGQ